MPDAVADHSFRLVWGSIIKTPRRFNYLIQKLRIYFIFGFDLCFFYRLTLTNPYVKIMLNVDSSLFTRRLHFFKKENIMIEVSKLATEQIAEYFKGKEVSPIRIFLNAGG